MYIGDVVTRLEGTVSALSGNHILRLTDLQVTTVHVYAQSISGL